MKNFLANGALIVVALLWIIGVDFMPFMKILGFPLVLLAFCFWVKYSDTFKKFCKFMDDGMSGKFDYYDE